jgi:hypothetical protein
MRINGGHRAPFRFASASLAVLVAAQVVPRNVLAEECRDVFQRDSRAPEDRFPAENVRRRSDSLLAPAIRRHVSLDGFAEMLALNEYLHVSRAKHDVRRQKPNASQFFFRGLVLELGSLCLPWKGGRGIPRGREERVHCPPRASLRPPSRGAIRGQWQRKRLRAPIPNSHNMWQLGLRDVKVYLTNYRPK